MGLCMCGSPDCPSCGNPEAARLEAAEEAAMQRFADAKLTTDEYAVAVEAGIAAVNVARAAVAAYQQRQRELAAEERDYEGLAPSEDR